MLVPVHFWQRTSNDGNRLATHLKIRIQCPEPTPNYDLAAGNAPETTKRTSNHIPAALPTCSWNEDLGRNAGGGEAPQKKSAGWKNNKKTEKLRTNPDFGRAKRKTKTHKGMEKKHLQNKISIKKMNSTSGLLKDKIHSNATRESKEK